MSPKRRSVADLFALAAAIVLLVALPVVMVFANRASAALLALATAYMVLALALDGDRRNLIGGLVGRARQSLVNPTSLLLIAFFLIALAGIPRTAHAPLHLWRLGEAFVPVATTALLILILPQKTIPLRFWMLATGLLVAVGLVLAEFAKPGMVRRLFGVREELWRLNRTLVTLVFLLPVLGILAETRSQRILALLIGAAVVVTAFLSDSASSALAALVLGAVSVLAWLHWAWMSRLVLFGTLMGIVIAPFHGLLLSMAMPDWLHEKMRSASSAIRVQIYNAFDSAIAAAPFFGSGFNTSTRFKDEPGFLRIPPELQSFVEFGHPHNAAVQLWLELGFVGVAIVCALIVIAFKALDGLPAQMRPLALGFWAAVVAVAIVSHGAWQAWWLALVGIGMVLFSARALELARSRDRA
ncbi:MAG: O-antigen ligase family protein [Rhabdaerophilum sp.]